MKKTENELTYVPFGSLITEVQVTPVRPVHTPGGTLVAFGSIRYRGEIDFADLALHAGPKDGQFEIIYPVKTLFGGVRVGVIRPVSKSISDAILNALVDRYMALVRKYPNYKEGV